MLQVTEEKLLLEKEVREELVTRVEVLEKVKGLLLLPAIGMATTQQVADFYEIGVEVINQIVNRHKDELLSDGYEIFKKGEVLDKLNVHDVHLEKLPSKTVVTFSNGDTLAVVNRGVRLFPKRAILRVGMLLRDSVVAKEVRNQLLNIEENAPDTIKVAEIDNELSSLGIEMGKAVAQLLTNAMSRFDAYVKQNNEKLENKLKAIEEEVKAITAAHNALLDDYVVTSRIAKRFTKDGEEVETREILDILADAGYIKRFKNGVLPTYLGQKMGAKTHVKYTKGYKYNYVTWTNRTVEKEFYPLFKEHGLKLKYSN